MSDLPQDKRIFPEEMHEPASAPHKSPNQQSHRILWSWLLAFLIIIGLGVVFYYLFYHLPKKKTIDVFEQTTFSKEEQEAIVRGLENSTAPLLPEERELMIDSFLGSTTSN